MVQMNMHLGIRVCIWVLACRQGFACCMAGCTQKLLSCGGKEKKAKNILPPNEELSCMNGAHFFLSEQPYSQHACNHAEPSPKQRMQVVIFPFGRIFALFIFCLSLLSGVTMCFPSSSEVCFHFLQELCSVLHPSPPKHIH